MVNTQAEWGVGVSMSVGPVLLTVARRKLLTAHVELFKDDGLISCRAGTGEADGLVSLPVWQEGQPAISSWGIVEFFRFQLTKLLKTGRPIFHFAPRSLEGTKCEV